MRVHRGEGVGGKLISRKEYLGLLERLLEESRRHVKGKNVFEDIIQFIEMEDNDDPEFWFCVDAVLTIRLSPPTSIYQSLNEILHIISSVLFITDLGAPGKQYSQRHKSKIFTMTFQYLQLIAFNNESLKTSYFQRINALIEKESIPEESTTAFLLFLRQWVAENPCILSDIELVAKYTKLLLDIMMAQREVYCNTNVLALGIFPLLISLKGEWLKANQNIIINLLLSLEYNKLFKGVLKSKLEPMIMGLSQSRDFLKITPIGKVRVSISNVKSRFVTAFFEALNACTKGHNSFTENFCQKLYKPYSLHNILRTPGICIELKQALVEYFMDSFLLTDAIDNINMVYIVNSLMKVK